MERAALAQFVDLAEKFKALGHPVRLSVMKLLKNCGKESLLVKEIHETIGIDQPAISRHLSIMRQNGLLVRQKKGAETYYRLNLDDKHVRCVLNCFD